MEQSPDILDLYLMIMNRYLVQKGGKIDLHSNNGQGPRPIHWASR